jgi:hypothetical protein
MSNVKEIDNLRLHSYAGSLSTEVAKRDRPGQPIALRPIPIRKPVVFQWPNPELNTPKERSALLAKAYSDFYHDPMQVLSAEKIMATIASMLTNILDPV